MRLFLLLFLFFVYLLSCSALSIVVSAAEPNERWAPAVRDASVCGDGLVVILGLDSAATAADTGLITKPDDVIYVKVSDERPPLDAVLDELYWQTVTIPDDDDLGAGVYGPLHPNVGSTRCLVEGRDA